MINSDRLNPKLDMDLVRERQLHLATVNFAKILNWARLLPPETAAEACLLCCPRTFPDESLSGGELSVRATRAKAVEDAFHASNYI